MRFLLILSLISTSFFANSQCCPYIDTVEVLPSNPTTTDNVKIATTVMTPSQGSFISSSYSISGNTIDVQACYYSGLLPATQTFFDTLDIGTLAAGTYTVNFTAFQSSDTVCNYMDSTIAILDFIVTGDTADLPSLKQEVGRIYPNPNSGAFAIELPGYLEPTHIRIMSVSGEIVHYGTFKTEMNLDIESGMYFVQFFEHNALQGYQRLIVH